MSLKLIGYIRVSSKTQTDNTSFESQTRAITNYCLRSEHDLLEVRRETMTASGKISRTVFDGCLADILKGKADGLVVYRLDRFARSTLEGLQVAATLTQYKKDLLVVDLGFDTSTPIGACIITVLLAFAELERNMILARVDEGKNRVKEAGFYSGGANPYGWMSTGSQGKRELKEHPIEQPILQEIIRLSDTGLSFSGIAVHLNKQGIPAKRGGKWTQSSIGSILTRQRVLVASDPRFSAEAMEARKLLHNLKAASARKPRMKKKDLADRQTAPPIRQINAQADTDQTS
ncbi:MAG: recombinase family protein [Candidatus Obscuribacterales bacterium]|nr:recombinase family protein [Candidatus Obscuribacterales bacterium]